MYLFGCCNQNYRYRTCRPSACKTEKAAPPPETALSFKTASSGGLTLSGFAGTEKEYDLVVLELETPSQKDAAINLNFACNLVIFHSIIDMRLQLVRTGAHSTAVPVASSSVYRRIPAFSGSDTICFTAHDLIPALKCPCSYLIKMYLSGSIPETGMMAVINPVLTATVL